MKSSPEHSNEDEVVDWLFGGSSRLDQDEEDLAARAGTNAPKVLSSFLLDHRFIYLAVQR